MLGSQHLGCPLFHRKNFRAIRVRIGKTAQYASNLLGQYERSKISFSPPDERTPRATVFEDAGAKCNISTEWQPILQPNLLMSGLRTGGAANGYLVDGVVIRPGMPFRNGLNCQVVSWSQKDHTMR